jgi:hypothetical protein
MSWLSSAGHFVTDELLGVDDFKSAYNHAKKGEWGAAAKSVGTGAFELGTTVAAPFTGGASLAAKGAVVAGKVAAKEGVKLAAEQGAKELGKVAVEQGAKTVSRTPLQAYASGTGKEFLSESFGVNGRNVGSTLTRTRTAPETPLWKPGKTPFEPTPPVSPKTPLKFDPTTPQKVTRSAPKGVDVINDAPDAVGLSGKLGAILPGAAAVVGTSLGSGLAPETQLQPEPNKLKTKPITEEDTKKRTDQDSGLAVGQQTATIPRIY